MTTTPRGPMKELAYGRVGLVAAASEADEGFSAGQINRNRSRKFVEAIATEFRRHALPSVRVFSKDCSDHRLEFGLDELPYDILVCEVATTPAAQQSKALPYVSRALWQIESEFAADTREALFDFNKLVLGSASHKLFIGPRVADESAFLREFHSASLCCSGEVYAALVSHPYYWRERPLEVTYWRSGAREWEPIDPNV